MHSFFKLFDNRLKMANKLFGREIASKLLPHYSCVSDTEENEDGDLISNPCTWRSLQYSIVHHLLDFNTIKSVRDSKGKNSANRCLESQRKYTQKSSNKFACSKLPEDCYSESFLINLKATQRISLDVQPKLLNLESLISQITPPELIVNEN